MVRPGRTSAPRPRQWATTPKERKLYRGATLDAPVLRKDGPGNRWVGWGQQRDGCRSRFLGCLARTSSDKQWHLNSILNRNRRGHLDYYFRAERDGVRTSSLLQGWQVARRSSSAIWSITRFAQMRRSVIFMLSRRLRRARSPCPVLISPWAADECTRCVLL